MATTTEAQRICATCGERVIPCFHTQSRRQCGWDHVTVADAGPCKGLCSAFDTAGETSSTVADEHYHQSDGMPGHRTEPPCICHTPNARNRPADDAPGETAGERADRLETWMFGPQDVDLS